MLGGRCRYLRAHAPVKVGDCRVKGGPRRLVKITAGSIRIPRAAQGRGLHSSRELEGSLKSFVFEADEEDWMKKDS